ncbi:MAG: Gfo/Idh/MocA family oxidoreductase [Gemmataceae bacterium]
MVRIGIAGIGFMGWIHYLAVKQLRGATLAAVHTRDPKKLAGDWTAIRGNFGPPGERVDLSGVKAYARFEEMLADQTVDLIDICTPTQQHEAMAVAALKAGKHVLVEKPIALATDAADRMVAAARDAGRLLMVGHVLPFFADFGFVLDAVKSGRYGKLLGGQFKRVIARPDWSASHNDVTQTGGPAIDLHIHDTHFIRLLCGMPTHVFSTGRVEGEAVVHLNTQYLYDDGPSIACTSGALAANSRPFVHGYEVYLEGATLVHESGVQPPTVLAADGQTTQPVLGGGGPIDSFAAELQAAVDGVVAGKAPDLLSGQLARDALVLCHREIESVRTGKVCAV